MIIAQSANVVRVDNIDLKTKVIKDIQKIDDRLSMDLTLVSDLVTWWRVSERDKFIFSCIRIDFISLLGFNLKELERLNVDDVVRKKKVTHTL